MGCCGSRDGCLGDREHEARELFESIKKRIKKSRALSYNEVGYPEKQDRRWDSNLSQDFAEGNRT